MKEKKIHTIAIINWYKKTFGKDEKYYAFHYMKSFGYLSDAFNKRGNIRLNLAKAYILAIGIETFSTKSSIELLFKIGTIAQTMGLYTYININNDFKEAMDELEKEVKEVKDINND